MQGYPIPRAIERLFQHKNIKKIKKHPFLHLYVQDYYLLSYFYRLYNFIDFNYKVIEIIKNYYFMKWLKL